MKKNKAGKEDKVCWVSERNVVIFKSWSGGHGGLIE